ncbi:MAG: cyclopropane-fatty-acyl-phospholipid synthase family protein [Alphaproteobacteria bacterium]
MAVRKDPAIVGIARSLLPPWLHGVGRAVWRRWIATERFRANARLRLSYLGHRLRGGSYLSWYARTLDQWAVEQRDDATMERRQRNLAESGREDLEILKHFGLQPHHSVHEFGCGMLRTAIHVIEYLEPGNYSGNDSSGERIETGRRMFADRIAERRPTLITNRDNSFDWLNGRTFDFLWCHAVFGHMPARDVEDTLRDVRKAMHAGSVFLFSYDPPPAGCPDVIEEDPRNWMQSLDFYRRAADRNGYVVEDVTDIVRGYPSWRTRIHLARLTLASGKG